MKKSCNNTLDSLLLNDNLYFKRSPLSQKKQIVNLSKEQHTMRQYFYILCFILIYSQLYGQSNYQLSLFKVKPNANIKGVHSSTKGLDVYFKFTPYSLDIPTQSFWIEIKDKGLTIAKESIDFTYQCSDSLAHLIDSIGMDSFVLDTTVHLYIPYRNIDKEEGTHDVSLVIWTKGQGLPVYNRAYRLHQVKIYDLFLDLKTATILPDSNANPIGLGYSAPDPKWLIHVGADVSLHGLKHRNAFKPKPKQFNLSITNYDSLLVCVYNADATANKNLGCFNIEHGSKEFIKTYQHAKNGRIEAAQFQVKKLERKPVYTDFTVQENSTYKGIKGIQVDFKYNLPLAYKRRSIRIQISDEKQAPLENILEVIGQRVVEENRIVGTYSYFIAYYNLQGSKRIKLKLTGNNYTIKQYESDDLRIKKTIEALDIEQTVGYQHAGISGILYKINFNIPEIPTEAQLKLSFPTLSPKTIAELFYWNAKTPTKIYKGIDQKIPPINEQTIFIFLPYFVAPATIQLAPRLSVEAIDVPSIKLATFDTETYACPNGLNDIQIEATSHEESLFTGISGQLFQFRTNIPDYYHSKGVFKLQILENELPIETNVFVNGDANEKLEFPIHNQKNITVFIPYRNMKEGARYTVQLQAQSKNFTLSEARAVQYSNQTSTLHTVEIYLQELQCKTWDEVTYRVNIRNDKNPNVTYPHLGYKTIVQETVNKNYKPAIPVANPFSLALNDEIVILINAANQPDGQILRFSTTIATLKTTKNSLIIKNQGSIKKAIFKVIHKN